MRFSFIFQMYKVGVTQRKLAQVYIAQFKDFQIENTYHGSKSLFFKEAINVIEGTINNRMFNSMEVNKSSNASLPKIAKEEQDDFEKSYDGHELIGAMQSKGLVLKGSIYIDHSDRILGGRLFRKPALELISEALKLAKNNTIEELDEDYLNEYYLAIINSFTYEDGKKPKKHLGIYFERNKDEIGDSKEGYYETITFYMKNIIQTFDDLKGSYAGDIGCIEYIEVLGSRFYYEMIEDDGNLNPPMISVFSNDGYEIIPNKLYFKTNNDTYLNYQQFVDFMADVSGLKVDTIPDSNMSVNNEDIDLTLKKKVLINIYTEKSVHELTIKGKQHYNHYLITGNRTASRGTNRKNSAHDKLLTSVSKHLNKEGNKEALHKVISELATFKKNIE